MTDEWERLELRCAISFQRLTDPAKGASCTHRSCCNFGCLKSHVSRARACPIAGCDAPMPRSHDVQRDDALRASLAAVPASVDVVWLRGTEVRTTPPAAPAAAAVLGKRRRVNVKEEPEGLGL